MAGQERQHDDTEDGQHDAEDDGGARRHTTGRHRALFGALHADVEIGLECMIDRARAARRECHTEEGGPEEPEGR